MFFDQIKSVEHTWANFEDGQAPYLCKCGESFNTHPLLITHTAESNPAVDVATLGTTGVYLERDSYSEKLNKALDFIEEVRGEQTVSFPWFDATTEFLKECGREPDNAS